MNPAWYIDRLDPEVYLSRTTRPLATRMQAYIGYARQIPQIAADIRANLHMPMAKTLLERGIAGFGGFATFYRNDVPKVFESIQDRAGTEAARGGRCRGGEGHGGSEAVARSPSARAPPTTLRSGEALFADMLMSTEQVDTPVAQLLKIGQADLDRNLAGAEGRVRAVSARRDRCAPAR